MNSNNEKIDPVDPENPLHGVTYPHPFADLAIALCGSASRDIRIQSPNLDPVVFDNPDLADAISSLARSDSHSRVYILVSDTRPMVQQGHRLLNLMRRLPSSISIRKLVRHPEMGGETLILRDSAGTLFMPQDEGPGFYEPDSRASAQPLIEQFDRLWQQGVEDSDLRRLGL